MLGIDGAAQTPPDVAESRIVAKEALDAHAAEDFDAAAAGYLRAFDLAPEAPYLIGAAISLNAAGDCAAMNDVVDRWETAESAPSAEQAAGMAGLRAKCAIADGDRALQMGQWTDAEAHAARALELSPTVAEDAARISTEAVGARSKESATASVATATLVAERPPTVVASPELPPPSKGATQGSAARIAGWTLVGVGTGAAALAVSRHFVFSGQKREYDTARADAGCAELCRGSADQYAAAETAIGKLRTTRTIAYVGWASAAALIGTGVTLLVLSPRAEISWLPPAGATLNVVFEAF